MNCQKETSEDKENQIPLDGRGGGVIAYCKQPASDNGNDYKIFAMNADGTGSKQLVSASFGLNHQDWSPDGTKLAAVGYVSYLYTWSIYVFNADGTELTRLTNTSNVWDSEPAWSPSGSQIAFSRVYPTQNDKRELWIMNADGSSQHYIGVDGFAPEWSKDGSKFIYSSNKSGNYEIYTCKIDGTEEQKITSSPINELFPAWSHDGSKIVFTAFTGAMSNVTSYEVYVMNADRTSLVQLTSNSSFDFFPRWSPDDLRIIFQSDRSTAGHYEIYAMKSDGSDVKQLTTTTGAYSSTYPAWKELSK